MVYTFYILYSAELDRYYIGHTGEAIEERLRKHLSDHGGFTSKARDWQLLYQEFFSSKREVYQRELQVKRWKSRQRIKDLIRKHSSAGSTHPG